MWTKSKSLMLSIFCTRLFLVLLVAGVIFAPQIVAWYFGESPDAQAIHLAFRITIYCCAVPGLFLLLCLHRLLRNLRRERVFHPPFPLFFPSCKAVISSERNFI